MKEKAASAVVLFIIFMGFSVSTTLGLSTTTANRLAAPEASTTTITSMVITTATQYSTTTIYTEQFLETLTLNDVQMNADTAKRVGDFTRNWIFLFSVTGGQITYNNTVRIYISSEGGDYAYSVLAGNYLTILEDQYNLNVEVIVIGECASGCFLFSTYASKVYLYPNATYGIHHMKEQYSSRFWSEFMSTIAQNRGWSVEYTESIAPILFNAEQAKNAGIIDGIIDSP